MTVRKLSCLALLSVLGIASLGALGPTPAVAGECDPWPGEPVPLPRLDSRDPVDARWAELRSDELSQRAAALERGASVESHLLWRRVLCLDPSSQAARAGAARTRPLHIHRPSVVASRPGPASGDPWALLSMPVSLGAGGPVEDAPPADAAAEALRIVEQWRQAARIENALNEADAKLRAARFKEALASAARARADMEAYGTSTDLNAARIRLEVVSGTAHVALGDEDEAVASFSRALAADPDLELDPATASPKVRRAFDAARAQRRSRW